MKTSVKIENIPKYNTSSRKLILRHLTKSEHYIKDIENGLPFFSEDQLASIEKSYPEGMTRDDLANEINKRGWLIKQSTISSYIQKKMIPGAIRRKKTEKGMISIYPNDIIRHLNFVRYILFSDAALAFLLDTVYSVKTQSDRSILEDTVGGINSYQDCFLEVQTNISANFDHFHSLRTGVENSFSRDKKKMSLYLNLIEELDDMNQAMWEKYISFLDMLEENSTEFGDIPPSTQETLERFFNRHSGNK